MCANYRGISLFDIYLKLFDIILLDRFKQFRELRTRENQAGFRSGRGCYDQVFTLRHILSERHESRQPSVVTFIDFEAAFDTANRAALWDGVPCKLVNISKTIHGNTQAR